MKTVFHLLCWMLAALLYSQPIYAATDVSSRTYNVLEKARELLEAQQEEEVVALLTEYGEKVQHRAKDYALVVRFLVPTLVRLDREKEAIERIELVAGDDIFFQEVGQVYGSLLVMNEHYEKAQQVLTRWIANEKKAPGDAYYTRAYAYFQSERYPQAETDLHAAIKLRANPPANWFDMLVACYFFQEKYQEAETLLRGLIQQDATDAKKWRLLAKIYLGNDNYPKALAALMTAYENGLLDYKDRQQIISLHAFLGMPERSARMLTEDLREGRAEADFPTLSRLAQYWLMGKERSAAKSVYEKAAALDKMGDTFHLLGNLYFEDAEWALAVEAYSNALQKDSMRSADDARLLLAVATFRMNEYASASKMLAQLFTSESVGGAARYWAAQLERKQHAEISP